MVPHKYHGSYLTKAETESRLHVNEVIAAQFTAGCLNIKGFFLTFIHNTKYIISQKKIYNGKAQIAEFSIFFAMITYWVEKKKK